MPSFMKLSDIRGDSQDPSHAGWIEIDSFAWGGSGAGTRPAGRTVVHEIVVTKKVDSASAQLYRAAANGTPIEQTTIHVEKDGKIASFELKGVTVASIQMSKGDQQGPVEMVTLVFDAAAVTQGASSPAGAAASMFSSATTAAAKAIGQAVANVARKQ